MHWGPHRRRGVLLNGLSLWYGLSGERFDAHGCAGAVSAGVLARRAPRFHDDLARHRGCHALQPAGYLSGPGIAAGSRRECQVLSTRDRTAHDIQWGTTRETMCANCSHRTCELTVTHNAVLASEMPSTSCTDPACRRNRCKRTSGCGHSTSVTVDVSPASDLPTAAGETGRHWPRAHL